jgi:hypothetical protein
MILLISSPTSKLFRFSLSKILTLILTQLLFLLSHNRTHKHLRLNVPMHYFIDFSRDLRKQISCSHALVYVVSRKQTEQVSSSLSHSHKSFSCHNNLTEHRHQTLNLHHYHVQQISLFYDQISQYCDLAYIICN